MGTIRRIAAFALIAGLSVLVSACTGGPSGKKSVVQLTLRDFRIEASTTSIASGAITFSATNKGSSTHEFEVFSVPSGVDANALPVNANVADTGRLKAIDEAEDIAPGTGRSLTADLSPGSYVLICNLPGHYKEGMYTTLTVD